jgi:hypothetical protein
MIQATSHTYTCSVICLFIYLFAVTISYIYQVTADNVLEYVQLQIRARMFEGTRLQLAHILRGIYEV